MRLMSWPMVQGWRRKNEPQPRPTLYPLPTLRHRRHATGPAATHHLCRMWKPEMNRQKLLDALAKPIRETDEYLTNEEFDAYVRPEKMISPG